MNADEPGSDEEFVCEPITPAAGTGDVRAMARGEPGLPTHFTWRDTEYKIVGVVRAWKSSSRERGVGELYLRKHWYTLEIESGPRMTVYCDRQVRNPRKPKARWWLYSIRWSDDSNASP